MIVDLIVGAVLVLSAAVSFLRGFIREVLTILGMVGGLAAAYFGGPHALPHIYNWLGVEEGVEPERLFGAVPFTLVGQVIAYGGVFIVVVLLLSLLSHVIAEVAKNLGLGAIDRTLGVVFGLVRGALVLGLLYLPIHLLVDPMTKEQWFKGSQTHVYLEATAVQIAQLLPQDTSEKVEEGVKTIEETMTTREKLQEMNVLRKDEKQQVPPSPEEELKQEERRREGYTEEFRDEMDQLFLLEGAE